MPSFGPRGSIDGGLGENPMVVGYSGGIFLIPNLSGKISIIDKLYHNTREKKERKLYEKND